MNDGSRREIRIPLSATVATVLTFLGALATAASALFVWHAGQRELLEGRLSLALDDAIYTLNQRDDRQDARRAELYRLLQERMDEINDRTNRMETLVLERALERIIQERVEETLEDE